MPAPCLAGSPWGWVTRWIVNAVTLGALCPGGTPGAPCEEVNSEPRAERCQGTEDATPRAPLLPRSLPVLQRRLLGPRHLPLAVPLKAELLEPLPSLWQGCAWSLLAGRRGGWC